MNLVISSFLFLFFIIFSTSSRIIALEQSKKQEYFGEFLNNFPVAPKKLLISSGVGFGLFFLYYYLFCKKNNQENNQENNNMIIIDGENNGQNHGYKNDPVKQEEVYSSEDLFLLSEQLADDWQELLRLTDEKMAKLFEYQVTDEYFYLFCREYEKEHGKTYPGILINVFLSGIEKVKNRSHQKGIFFIIQYGDFNKFENFLKSDFCLLENLLLKTIENHSVELELLCNLSLVEAKKFLDVFNKKFELSVEKFNNCNQIIQSNNDFYSESTSSECTKLKYEKRAGYLAQFIKDKEGKEKSIELPYKRINTFFPHVFAFNSFYNICLSYDYLPGEIQEFLRSYLDINIKKQISIVQNDFNKVCNQCIENIPDSLFVTLEYLILNNYFSNDKNISNKLYINETCVENLILYYAEKNTDRVFKILEAFFLRASTGFHPGEGMYNYPNFGSEAIFLKALKLKKEKLAELIWKQHKEKWVNCRSGIAKIIDYFFTIETYSALDIKYFDKISQEIYSKNFIKTFGSFASMSEEQKLFNDVLLLEYQIKDQGKGHGGIYYLFYFSMYDPFLYFAEIINNIACNKNHKESWIFNIYSIQICKDILNEIRTRNFDVSGKLQDCLQLLIFFPELLEYVLKYIESRHSEKLYEFLTTEIILPKSHTAEKLPLYRLKNLPFLQNYIDTLITPIKEIEKYKKQHDKMPIEKISNYLSVPLLLCLDLSDDEIIALCKYQATNILNLPENKNIFEIFFEKNGSLVEKFYESALHKTHRILNLILKDCSVEWFILLNKRFKKELKFSDVHEDFFNYIVTDAYNFNCYSINKSAKKNLTSDIPAFFRRTDLINNLFNYYELKLREFEFFPIFNYILEWQEQKPFTLKHVIKNSQIDVNKLENMILLLRRCAAKQSEHDIEKQFIYVKEKIFSMAKNATSIQECWSICYIFDGFLEKYRANGHTKKNYNELKNQLIPEFIQQLYSLSSFGGLLHEIHDHIEPFINYHLLEKDENFFIKNQLKGKELLKNILDNQSSGLGLINDVISKKYKQGSIPYFELKTIFLHSKIQPKHLEKKIINYKNIQYLLDIAKNKEERKVLDLFNAKIFNNMSRVLYGQFEREYDGNDAPTNIMKYNDYAKEFDEFSKAQKNYMLKNNLDTVAHIDTYKNQLNIIQKSLEFENKSYTSLGNVL